MTDTTTRRRSGAKPGAKPTGLPLSRNVGVSLYATDEAIAQSIGQGVTSKGVQIALRNMGEALKAMALLAETRSYIQRMRETWREAYDNPDIEYRDDGSIFTAICNADDLLRRIDELQAAMPIISTATSVGN